MSREAAQAALDRMAAHEEFAIRVRDTGSPEAGLALLKAEGFDVTLAELREATLGRFAHLLTEKQLDALAGGISYSPDFDNNPYYDSLPVFPPWWMDDGLSTSFDDFAV